MANSSSARALIELLHGRGAHTDPVACLDGVTLEAASCVPAASPHSIWQLLWHLNYWMDYDLRRIRGEGPPYPAHNDESFPATPAPRDATEWQHEIVRFQQLLAEYATLAGSGRGVLEREVPPTHPSHAQRASSVESMLWQIIAHNSYHAGQIALLRRLLGIWPPPGGGDTW